jgi:hypothetical protein
MPALSNSSIIGGDSLAGPIVQTILVLRLVFMICPSLYNFKLKVAVY